MYRGCVKRPARFAFPSSSSSLLLPQRVLGATTPLSKREFNGIAMLSEKDPKNQEWKSKFNRERRDWRKPGHLVIHDHPGNPYYPFVRPQPTFGVWEAFPEGLDPPTPFYPISKYRDPFVYQPEVLSYKDNCIKFILLNRPAEYNALNLPAVKTLLPLVKKWDKQKVTTYAMVLASSTNDHLSAGSDFIDVYNSVKNGKPEEARTFFRELYKLMLTINTLEKPYFPIMNGYTMGSGAGLVFNSDSFRITTEDAIFAMPEVGMGFVPDCGATHFLAQLPDEIGTFLALTGKRMRGWDLLHAGIATHVVPNDRMKEFVDALAAVDREDRSSILVMDALYANACQPGEHPFLFEKRGYLDVVKRCFSKDTVPEIMAALEHEFEPWAHQVLETMKENCPLSMAVTLKLIRQGKTNTLADAIDAEYRAAVRLIEMPDFKEGVRARLIEKRKPKWSHSSVSQVTAKEVDRILAPLPSSEELDSVRFYSPYVRRMKEVDTFINHAYSELCFTMLKNKLMQLTTIKDLRSGLQMYFETEEEQEYKPAWEALIADVDEQIRELEAIDPENPSEESKAVLADARSHLEQLARGKVSMEEWKAKLKEIYKRWAAITRPAAIMDGGEEDEEGDKEGDYEEGEEEGEDAGEGGDEGGEETEEEVYGWSKFFRKETEGSSGKGERLGDRLAERLKALSGATSGAPGADAAKAPTTPPTTAATATTTEAKPSPFASATGKSTSSLADKLFGKKPAAGAGAAAAGNAASTSAAVEAPKSLTQSLLAAVAKQQKVEEPKEPIDNSDLFPPAELEDDDMLWDALSVHWDQWALPSYVDSDPPVIHPKTIGQDKFETWVNAKVESPRARREKFLKAKNWTVNTRYIRNQIDDDNIITDRLMAHRLDYVGDVYRPFEHPEVRYWKASAEMYFRDRIRDPIHLLNVDAAFHNYAYAAGELSTWKDRIRVRDAMERKKAEAWAQTGYTHEDLVDWVVECHEESQAIPARFRHVQDIDLVVARSLKGWHETPNLHSINLHSLEEDAVELSREDIAAMEREDDEEDSSAFQEEYEYLDEEFGDTEDDIVFDDDEDDGPRAVEDEFTGPDGEEGEVEEEGAGGFSYF